jgi:hypothetical protein
MTRQNAMAIMWNREKVTQKVPMMLHWMTIAAMKWTLPIIVFTGRDKTKWRKVKSSIHI